MKKLKSQRGSIAVIVLTSLLFLTMFLTGSYIIISNKLKTQKDIITETRQIYENYDLEEIYNSYFNNGQIPVYSNDEYLAIGTSGKVIVPEVGGKYYDFTDDGNYILMNDLVIKVEDYPKIDWEKWQAPEHYFENNDLAGKIDYNGHIVTIVREDGTKQEYDGIIVKDPSSVTGKWAKLWETTELEDGTLAITDYLYDNEELQTELRKTEAELLDNVTVPNKINGIEVSKVTGTLGYEFTGEFTVSSGILLNAEFLEISNYISKIILKDDVTISVGFACFAGCTECIEIESGNNCISTSMVEGQGYIFRSCQKIEKITLGDNCSFLGTYPFRYAGAEEIEIVCGKNTSLNLSQINSTTKKMNTENATFDYLDISEATIDGDLIVNENGYMCCVKSTVNGKLEAKDNSQVGLRATTITGDAILGNNLKFLSGGTTLYAFYKFEAQKIIINGKLLLTGTYGEFQFASPLPSKIEVGKTSSIGKYCFGGTDLEYLIIDSSAEFSSREAIFFQCKKVKAVIINLSEEWTKEEFLNSIGTNIDSEWLGRMTTGTFYDTPVYDTDNNRLIYYSTNLTKDQSEVLKLIAEAGL